MFALPLSDPLWRKLDDAHRDRDIPAVLRGLSENWNEDAAKSLFWDCLCHRDTCYGATYAATPHLLQIAEAALAPETVRDIAHFLGHVALVAFSTGGCCGFDDGSIPQGLSLDLETWDRKLDTYRSLAEHARKDLADPNYPENELRLLGGGPRQLVLEQWKETFEALAAKALAEFNVDDLGEKPLLSRESRQAELDRYEEILSRPAMDEQDLTVITRMRVAFFEALPAIADLCARAYQTAEDLQDLPYFLSGLAAALGDRNLAQLLNHGDNGVFHCANCGWRYEFAVFGERLACYASPVGPTERPGRTVVEDPLFLDWQDGAPDRADAFVQPCETLDASEPAVARIHELASARGDLENMAKLRNFKGTVPCGKCGVQASLRAFGDD